MISMFVQKKSRMYEVAKCVDIVDYDFFFFFCSVVCTNFADSKYWMKMTRMLIKKINPLNNIRSLVDSDQSAMVKYEMERAGRNPVVSQLNVCI